MISLLYLILRLFCMSVIQHIFHSVFGRLIHTQVFLNDYKCQNGTYLKRAISIFFRSTLIC